MTHRRAQPATFECPHCHARQVRSAKARQCYRCGRSIASDAARADRPTHRRKPGRNDFLGSAYQDYCALAGTVRTRKIYDWYRRCHRVVTCIDLGRRPDPVILHSRYVEQNTMPLPVTADAGDPGPINQMYGNTRKIALYLAKQPRGEPRTVREISDATGVAYRLVANTLDRNKHFQRYDKTYKTETHSGPRWVHTWQLASR
jgi:hypothetical protein